jgi:hypothetical protein
MIYTNEYNKNKAEIGNKKYSSRSYLGWCLHIFAQLMLSLRDLEQKGDTYKDGLLFNIPSYTPSMCYMP